VTFEEFVSVQLPALTRYARVLTGDRQDAHDVLADALIVAHLRWRRISKMDYPAAYVRRIVTSTFLSRKRRWSARNVKLTATGDLPERAGADATAQIDDQNQLHGLLAQLPDRQRAALVLRYFLDLSDQQTADELGCTRSTVRSLVARGLASLRIANANPQDTTRASTGKDAP